MQLNQGFAAGIKKNKKSCYENAINLHGAYITFADCGICLYLI